MTSDEQRSLIPLVEALQKRGIISTWAMTSWPTKPSEFPSSSPAYRHAFWISAPGLINRLFLCEVFTEDVLVQRIALAQARQNHGDAITATMLQAGETLVRDLAAIYAGRLRGKRDLPVPDHVIIKDTRVQLTHSTSTLP